jgi:hypothetical protein
MSRRCLELACIISIPLTYIEYLYIPPIRLVASISHRRKKVARVEIPTPNTSNSTVTAAKTGLAVFYIAFPSEVLFATCPVLFDRESIVTMRHRSKIRSHNSDISDIFLSSTVNIGRQSTSYWVVHQGHQQHTMWGLVLSAVTIGASVLGKPRNESTSRSSESTQLIAAGGDRTFLSGVGTCTDVDVR